MLLYNEPQGLDLEIGCGGVRRQPCASCIHVRHGVLPSFQPYPAFQATLSRWLGTDVPLVVPWLLSFLNGMTIVGFLFARLQRLLPGRTGVSKGLAFGLIGWLFMGLIFFPVIGLGLFAAGRLGYCPGGVVVWNGSDLQHSAGHRIFRA
jgi:hypothetical protein